MRPSFPLPLQTSLLRVLETGEIRKVGSSETKHVDVRIVAASHKNLRTEVMQGRFREDLFYRLHVIPMYIPPLRERKSDIRLLAELFLTRAKSKKMLDDKAWIALEEYNWPGNVRELKNVMERALILSGTSFVIEAEHVCLELMEHPRIIPEYEPLTVKSLSLSNIDREGPKTLEQVEKETISLSLQMCGGNKSRSARELGIAKSTLHEKIKKYGI
ncbi:MAG: sigma 54-interacting transcriptional regulator [Bdellovibrionota bacterium]